MGNFDGKFDSTKQDWETPQELYEKLDEEFCFDIDLAADELNAKCDRYYTEETDSMLMTWKGVCWLNPPYGARGYRLSQWVEMAYSQTRKDGCVVVMLIPARTNTAWWHKYCMNAAEVRFIEGRPKFGGAEHGLPQPLAIIVFKNTNGDSCKFSGMKL